MKDFIELTAVSGRPVFVNKRHILTVISENEGSIITFNYVNELISNKLQIKNSYDSVVKLINEI